MRVMLIFPPNVEAVEPFKSAKNKPPALLWGFPLGLGYVAAVLREKGFEVSILDACFDSLSMDDVIDRLKAYHPDLVGIGSLTHVLKSSVELAREIKDYDKNIKIVFGGPHSTYDYENLLRFNYYYIDYIVIGEGEQTFLELCESLKHNEPLDSIKGIAFRDTYAGIKRNTLRPLIEDLDSLPFPARDLVDFKRYIKSYGVLVKSVDIMSSRGCTNRCVFCSSSHFFTKWRTRSPENIIAETKELVKKYPEIRSINFMDDDFTVDKQRVIKLCNLMIAEGLNKLNWVCLARVDQVDEEMVYTMKSAGCLRVHLGIESGDQQILKNINKCITLDEARRAVRLLSEADIEAYSFFMLGHPGETKQTIRSTRLFAKELTSANTGFFVTQIFPGTALAKLQPVKDWVNYIYEPEINNPSIFTHPCVPNFIPDGFSREKLKEICRSITRQFIIIHFLKRYRFFIKRLINEPGLIINYIFNVFLKK